MLSDGRWVEVTPSNHAHEQEGLQILRQLLPDEPPFRAWTNFEFKDGHGHWHEVDALVLGRRRLHLVELKYYSGLLQGTDTDWFRSGHPAEKSPLLLARRKAQRFASKMKEQLVALERELGVQPGTYARLMPWVQESVFIHHPMIRSALVGSAGIGIFGLDDHEYQTHLASISDRLLEESQGKPQLPDDIVGHLLARMGLVERRELTVGSWNLFERLEPTETHQDWLANHIAVTEERARIRFPILHDNDSAQHIADINKVVDHEYKVMQGLSHDGLLRPKELVVHEELGHGLVFPFDDKAERLDLWLARRGQTISLDTRLSVIRQVAEALQYAHRNKVVHRGLSPYALWVRERPDGGVKVLVGEWRSVGSAGDLATATRGVTVLHAQGIDEEEDQEAVFQAPEGVWSTTANRIRLDMFGLGATAYFVLTGHLPANDRNALLARLRDQSGLDISVDLPAASTELRNLVLAATQGVPSQRTSDVGDILELLAAAQRVTLNPDTNHATDPLEARPGESLDQRFTLVRRLGAGSTAVGLLVQDNLARTKEDRVLKTALNDDAARRLQAEADILRGIRSSHIVRLEEGPLRVGGRDALLLSDAGSQTLAEELALRPRLSLDMLDRWGDDLLAAVEDLEKLGLHHRDIKPANLGIQSKRARHLVLFDFSLSSVSPRAIAAGTAPYLDPFLGDDRPVYDAAADLYAASVVLFEMATGTTPVYGDDPSAHPRAVAADITLSTGMFDPAVAQHLLGYFARALSRDAAQRFASASVMRAQWHQAFTQTVTVAPDDDDELAARAELTTPLNQAGFGPRMLSAVEQFGVDTVGDLLAVDPVALMRIGTSDNTRKQVRARVKQWIARFGDPKTLDLQAEATLPPLDEMYEALLRVAVAKPSQLRSHVVHCLLGDNSQVDPFATQAEITASAPKPPTLARTTQLIADLQERWAKKPESLEVLRQLDQLMRSQVEALGGVATVDELTRAVLAAVPGGLKDNEDEFVRARGLVRIASDRQRNLQRADEDSSALVWRRRGRTMSLVGSDSALLDAVDHLGQIADDIVKNTPDQGAMETVVVPAERAQEQLRQALPKGELPEALLATPRLAQLAAGLSTITAASAIGELHHRRLQPARALQLTLGTLAPSSTLTTPDITSRVANRFPALEQLPERPRLDQLLREAQLDLEWNEGAKRFISRQLTDRATGLASRHATRISEDLAPVSVSGVTGQRLLDSRRSRSFLALGVAAQQQDRLHRVLAHDFEAHVIDLAALTLAQLKQVASAGARPIPWQLILASDAAEPGSRDRRGVQALMGRVAEAVRQQLDKTIAALQGNTPVVLAEGSLLARYGHLDVLTHWNDLAATRPQAIWLVLPQTQSNRGPVLDGHPVQGSPNQFVPIDPTWLDIQWNRLFSQTPAPDASGATA
ncbi:BREX system serine/threonine kinase PglW [Luteococcus peritonei]